MSLSERQPEPVESLKFELEAIAKAFGLTTPRILLQADPAILTVAYEASSASESREDPRLLYNPTWLECLTRRFPESGGWSDVAMAVLLSVLVHELHAQGVERSEELKKILGWFPEDDLAPSRLAGALLARHGFATSTMNAATGELARDGIGSAADDPRKAHAIREGFERQMVELASRYRRSSS